MRVTSPSRRTLDDACYLSQLLMCDTYTIRVLSLSPTAGLYRDVFTSFSDNSDEVYVKKLKSRLRGTCAERHGDFACALGAFIVHRRMLWTSLQ